MSDVKASANTGAWQRWRDVFLAFFEIRGRGEFLFGIIS